MLSNEHDFYAIATSNIFMLTRTGFLFRYGFFSPALIHSAKKNVNKI